MISLIIAGENRKEEDSKTQNDQNFEDIELELDGLESLIKEKL